MTTKSMFLGFGLLLLGACAADNLGRSSAAVSGVGDTCTGDADCVNGLECEHGACAQHGKDRGDAGVDDHGDDGDDHDIGDDRGDDGGDHDVGEDDGDDGDAGHRHGGDDDSPGHH